MDVKTLRDGDWKGKRVLVRADLNVPLKGSRVADDTRIAASLPTIRALQKAGAQVILCSHLGRPKGVVSPEFSLEPVAVHMSKKLDLPCTFAGATVGPEVSKAISEAPKDHVVLLENVRFHPEETSNDEAFAKQLASLADCFVNDAFGTAHRAHASTSGVASFLPSYAGLLIEKELAILGDALANPERPFTAVLGGAKVSDKIAVIEALLEKADRIIVGGGMAFTFLKAQGHDVGKSMVEEDRLELANQLLQMAKDKGVEVMLPEDVEEASSFDSKAAHRAVRVGRQDPNWMGLDIGPLAMERFAQAVRDSRTVIWNGPMGVFEWDAFKFGTRAVAQAMADCTGTTIVGGGDSAAAAKRFRISDQVSHVSTGGGASLQFLEGRALPGIEALKLAASRS